MKHLFSHSPEQFEDFAFEVKERESLLSITAKTTFEIYFEAVKSVTRKWFAELLNNKQKNTHLNEGGRISEEDMSKVC
jgi:hypothetical protein